jgi:cytochrome o ubiquinol oxidase subunit 2
MNAFFVPQLGSMVATMNGMVTQLHLQADHPGDYYGESAQFSGDGFSDMHFTMHAVPPDRFAQWIESVRSKSSPLDSAAYQALARESSGNAPAQYGTVEPGLFDRIVSGEARHRKPGG